MTTFLSVKEVAQQLRVTVDKVTDLIHSKQLNAFNVTLTPGARARWRISENDLDEFLASRQSKPAAMRVEKAKKPALAKLQPGEITYY